MRGKSPIVGVPVLETNPVWTSQSVMVDFFWLTGKPHLVLSVAAAGNWGSLLHLPRDFPHTFFPRPLCLELGHAPHLLAVAQRRRE